jgi:pyruvate, water dikinase
VAEGVGRIGAGFYPKDVIVRLSDFKIQRIRQPDRRPSLRTRGGKSDDRLARRLPLLRSRYKAAFELECKALLKARGDMGLTNIKLMVPFCRTPEEGRKVIEVLREFGLVQGENGLEVYVMCEIPQCHQRRCLLPMFLTGSPSAPTT